MTELAVTQHGTRFELPEHAAFWRVRQLDGRGPPRVGFRNGGGQTFLPVHAGLDDLRRAVDSAPGRYRLEAFDQQRRPIKDLPVAYADVTGEPGQPSSSRGDEPPDNGAAAAIYALSGNPTEILLLEVIRSNHSTLQAHNEVVRANTELARTVATSVTDRLADIMRASAQLIAAADGANLPRRKPITWYDDEDDDSDDDIEDAELEPNPQQHPLLQLLPTITSALGGAGNLGALGKLLGSGGAASSPATAPLSTSTASAPPPSSPPAVTIPAAQPASPSPTPAEAPRNAAPVDTKDRLIAILSQLSPDERAYAERVMAQLSPAAMAHWIETLVAHSVDDAVALIRSHAQTPPQEPTP